MFEYDLKLPEATILLVKQDPLRRHGLSKILSEQDSLEVVNCGNFCEGIQLAKQYRSDIILLDWQFLSDRRPQLLTNLKEQSPESKVIICGTQLERESILKIYSLRLAGYYYDDGDINQLLLAIATAAIGGLYVHPRIKHLLTDNLLLPISQLGLDRLAPQEVVTLKHLVTGKDYQEIGELMFVSSHTVRNYVYQITKKLGLKNRVQAAVAAVRGGLLQEL